MTAGTAAPRPTAIARSTESLQAPAEWRYLAGITLPTARRPGSR